MGQKQTSSRILGQTFLNCLSQILSPTSAFFIFASGLSWAYQHPEGTEQTLVQHWEKQGDHFLAALPWINISVTSFIMIRDAQYLLNDTVSKDSLKKCYQKPDLPHVVTMVNKQIFQIKCLEINYLIDDTVNFSFFYRLLYCLCCFSNWLRYLFCSSRGKIEEVTFHRQKKERPEKRFLYIQYSFYIYFSLSLGIWIPT